MASISSLTSKDTNTSRVTGLASGMDVDELVDAMTLTTQSKINKINQNIQRNEWKTEAYRDLISKFSTFTDKYLSLTSKNSMRLSSNYSAYSVTAKGSAAQYLQVSASTASGASAASNLVIGGVSSVATAAHYSTGSVINSKMTASDAIKQSYEVNNIKGQTIGFQINDGTTVTHTFDAKTVEDAVKELNEAFGENITAEYADGKLTISAKEGNTLKFTGVTNSVKDIFGISTDTVVDAENSYEAAADTSKVTSEAGVADAVAGKTITFNYNGSSKKITIDEAYINEYLSSAQAAGKSEEENTSNAIAYALQKGLDNAFGAGKVVADVSDDNKLTFETAYSTSTLSITAADDVVKQAMGIDTTSSNRVNLSGKAISDIDLSTKLQEADTYKIKVNDIELSFSKDDTVSTIMSKINNSGAGVTVSYSNTSNSFSFVANETGSQGRIDIEDVSGNLAQSLFNITADTDITEGTDTVMSVSFDGGNTFNDVIRSTSSFSLDGVSLTLDKDIVNADFSKPIEFVADNDTDKVYNNIKSMIDDYNKLIEEINSAVKTRPDSDYAPLTDAQKEEMTDEQIEKWEEKAKAGILYGDSEIRNLTYELTNAVVSVVNGVGLSSSIGLSSSSDYSKGGVIEIDEEKLKTAIKEDPDKIIQMFTNDTENSSGIMERINDVVKKYAGTTLTSNISSRTRGILVNKAGIVDHISENDNSLNDELKALKEELEKMETRLEEQKEKLYDRFSYLEDYVSQQNSMSSWITAQLGY